MEGGQRALDARRLGRLVPPDVVFLRGHVVVEPAPDRILQQADGLDVASHHAILGTTRVDVRARHKIGVNPKIAGYRTDDRQ